MPCPYPSLALWFICSSLISTLHSGSFVLISTLHSASNRSSNSDFFFLVCSYLSAPLFFLQSSPIFFFHSDQNRLLLAFAPFCFTLLCSFSSCLLSLLCFMIKSDQYVHCPLFFLWSSLIACTSSVRLSLLIYALYFAPLGVIISLKIPYHLVTPHIFLVCTITWNLYIILT